MSDAIDEIKACVEYLSIHDPNFGAAISGCSDEEIAELESLVRQPLDPHYRAFLLTMGRDNGNLLNSLGCDFTIGAVVARYKSDGRDIAPFTFIAADARDSDFDYYLEALDDEEASARVVKRRDQRLQR